MYVLSKAGTFIVSGLLNQNSFKTAIQKAKNSKFEENENTE